MTQPKYAFFGGKIVPMEEAKVSVMTHAFNYGTGVFGGLRAYWNADEQQLFIFRPHDHFERFRQSAGLIRIDVPYSETELTDILIELLRVEDFHENVYIRPLAYKSTEIIGVKLHDLDDAVTMFAQPFGSYVKNEEGLHVGFSAWRRVDDNAIPARGKIVGAYANSALIKSDAVLAGYDEALVLNQDGHVSEASAANIFVIRKGVAITPPVNANVLEGIVRRSLIELLRNELGVEVVERNLDRTEVLRRRRDVPVRDGRAGRRRDADRASRVGDGQHGTDHQAGARSVLRRGERARPEVPRLADAGLRAGARRIIPNTANGI